MNPSTFPFRRALPLLLVLSLGCEREPSASGSSGSQPPATSTTAMCTPDPEVPNHPGCVEMVDPDGKSKIVAARDLPESIRMVGGKPVVKIVNTGHCISKLGVDGNELENTMLAPSR